MKQPQQEQENCPRQAAEEEEVVALPRRQYSGPEIDSAENEIGKRGGGKLEGTDESTERILSTGNDYGEDEKVEIMKEIEDDLDVEGVLRKQNTYDLVCPNCGSCITKTVILRRSKPPGENENGEDEKREDKAIKCLSCCSIFIPIGRCFRDFCKPSPSESRGLEILKSIVYGGLIESITSLGVVSSAAGGGASTLNILALGLANLITGLFVLIHNLRDLKNDQSRGVTSETSAQEDQYQELLGQRENYGVHTTVSILSYLIFGLVPPVVYGFSFRQSNDRDLKLAAVAAASFVCIILLAIGKAYVGKPQRSYFRTVLYYVIAGISASGVSFLVGEFVRKLLEKLGWFESSSSLIMPLLEAKPLKGTWASF